MLGLVADDLTGAADAAVGLAEAGWRAVLLLDPRADLPPEPGSRPTVLAVSTGSRAACDDEAATRTAHAVGTMVATGAERLYLKVDSTVRGSVAGQLTGALAAWSRHHPQARAVVCPAFPAHLRTVVDGEVLVAGAPLAGSAAALDPVTPRSDGDLTRLLPGAVRHADDGVQGPPGSVLVADARDDADLDRLARRIDEAGPELVVVGSGGLAAALGRRWLAPTEPPARPALEGRLLLAVSSLHPVSAAQLERLRDAPAADHVDVLTTVRETSTAQAAAAGLADRVADALSHGSYAALVVVGGDGAAAILARLGADRVEIDGAVVPGCPTGTVSGGQADGVRLVTKSGGFGTPAALHEIVSLLRATRAPAGPDHPHAGPRPTLKEAP